MKSDDFGAVLFLALICGIGYWFFFSDDLEDTVQSAVEAALEGDADEVMEYTPYIGFWGKWSIMGEDDNVTVSEGIGTAMAVESYNSEMAARFMALVGEAEYSDVEVLDYVVRDTESKPQAAVRLLLGGINGALEVDESANALVKVTFDDDSIAFYQVKALHIEESDFLNEGWKVIAVDRDKVFDSEEAEEADEYAARLIESKADDK